MKLEYRRSTDTNQSSGVWRVLGGASILSPFLSVPIFIFGTALLQDNLVSEGHSWLRASLWMGVPTGLVTCASVIGAIRALVIEADVKKVAMFAVSANLLSLAIIIGGIIRAAE